MRKLGVVAGVLLVVAGVAVVVTAVVGGVQGFMGALTPVAQWSSPGSHRAELAAGDWVVFQAAPQGAPTRSLMAWDDVTVTGPEGRVPTTCGYCGSSETLTLGRDHFVGILRFTAEEPGTYTFTSESGSADLAVAPPALQTVGGVFASLGWVALGVFLAALGAVLLLVVLVLHLTRRPGPSSTPTPSPWPPPGGPPAGT